MGSSKDIPEPQLGLGHWVSVVCERASVGCSWDIPGTLRPWTLGVHGLWKGLTGMFPGYPRNTRALDTGYPLSMNVTQWDVPRISQEHSGLGHWVSMVCHWDSVGCSRGLGHWVSMVCTWESVRYSWEILGTLGPWTLGIHNTWMGLSGMFLGTLRFWTLGIYPWSVDGTQWDIPGGVNGLYIHGTWWDVTGMFQEHSSLAGHCVSMVCAWDILGHFDEP